MILMRFPVTNGNRPAFAGRSASLLSKRLLGVDRFGFVGDRLRLRAVRVAELVAQSAAHFVHSGLGDVELGVKELVSLWVLILLPVAAGMTVRARRPVWAEVGTLRPIRE